MTTSSVTAFRLNNFLMASAAPGIMDLLNRRKDIYSTFISLVEASQMSNTLERGL